MLATAPSQVITTFTFFGHIPSKKNSKRLIGTGRRPRMISSEAYLEWERQELATLVDAPRLYPPYDVSIVFYPGSLRIFDCSNSEESLNDLLVKAGALVDDNWKVLRSVVREVGGLDIENPRVEYTVRSSSSPVTVAQIESEFEFEAKLQRKLLKIKQRSSANG
jgi:hypothetical protein